ncbi:MAG: peptidoglycan DD-metalloendopeptidase family protein [Clostridia bacterium]|jgi:murein DD-endopeptidase MepM/ murein hydrolase activator NlpD|nr:peptidoglycan DD-metalloendopeptidase family protein [Clostridia bacterium]
MKKKVAVFLTLLLILTPVYASSLNNKKNQLSNTKEEIESTKNALQHTATQKEQVKKEIQTVDNQIVGIESKIADLNTKLQQKQTQVKESEEALNTAVIQKDDQYEATKGRMVQMYKNQKIGYIQVVFSSSNFWEAVNRLEYIKRIAEQDSELIEAYEEQVEQIDIQRLSLEQEKKALDLLHKEQVAKKSELTAARSKKDSVLGQLAGEEERLQAEIKEMQEASKKLEQEIKRLTQQSTIKYAGGAFGWPVPGWYNLSSEYNPRTSPISGRYEFHSGIDIPASFGTPVVAAADGVVITSGWVNGYGNTVMINHGSGLVTLYGHNSSLTVSNGQTVKKGQTVARVGSTGYSTGNHCHFEVRKNGAHTSPWGYLKR